MKYNIFDLIVVKMENKKFICIYNEENNSFTEVLTKTSIKSEEVQSIEFLSNYENDRNDDMISLKDILLMYIEINKTVINNKDFDIDGFIKIQEKEIENFDRLKKSNPELARIIAKKNLQNTGIIDDKGDVLPPYDKVFIKNSIK